jgi:hypothetical protein
MKKSILVTAMCFLCAGFAACGTESGAESGTSSLAENEQTTASAETEQTTASTETEQTTASAETEQTTGSAEESGADALTEDQALAAVKNYCLQQNPELKTKAESDETAVYWDASANADGRIVVLFRSYTGAQIRYYVDPVSGEAYVTELVPGIIDEEQRTEESLNVRDYLE